MPAALGARRRPGRRGKGGGVHGEWIRPSISEEGPHREGSHGGGRRSALAGAAVALQGLAAARARGKRKRATVGPFSLTHHGLGCIGAC